MTQAETDKIIKAEVKATLARGEPIDRLLDDHVRAALFHRHPGFVCGNFLPQQGKCLSARSASRKQHNNNSTTTEH